ncbi:MAG: hypothetical protein AB7I98_04480 [Verrucomicrobiales bacterium]|nr:hypothetical protein [Verrucomicrobiae bacterium]MCP5554934.1 hypothetical protein [Akkermansiaceae bacterium]
MNTKLYLGLDGHQTSIVVATALADGSDQQSHGKWCGSNLSAERGLLKIRQNHQVEKSEISIVSEAGRTGFVFARRLQWLGYHGLTVGLRIRQLLGTRGEPAPKLPEPKPFSCE